MTDDITVAEAQRAYAVVGAERADEILGDGGLSGADRYQLRELVEAANEIPHVVQPHIGPPISSCCGEELNVTGVERTLVRWPVAGYEDGKVRLVAGTGQLLEAMEEQDVEVWCGKCEQTLAGATVSFDGE